MHLSLCCQATPSGLNKYLTGGFDAEILAQMGNSTLFHILQYRKQNILLTFDQVNLMAAIFAAKHKCQRGCIDKFIDYSLPMSVYLKKFKKI